MVVVVALVVVVAMSHLGSNYMASCTCPNSKLSWTPTSGSKTYFHRHQGKYTQYVCKADLDQQPEEVEVGLMVVVEEVEVGLMVVVVAWGPGGHSPCNRCRGCRLSAALRVRHRRTFHLLNQCTSPCIYRRRRSRTCTRRRGIGSEG